MGGNQIQDTLCSLGICDAGAIDPFFKSVRDRDDISVLKCRKSGVIFLSRCDHIARAHYEARADLKYWGAGDRKVELEKTALDDERRAEQFRARVAQKVWLDVGTGLGGILDLLSGAAAKTIAVEPQTGIRDCLRKEGYQVFADLAEVPDRDVEVVTLFHVFEHFTEPLEALRQIKKMMKPGGKIIIEVPHAGDALISSFDLEAFKAFTFWSEHLILHTRRSLAVFLEAAGFRDVVVRGFQRYPLANHLYWLAKGKPGGHQVWEHWRSPLLEKAYEDHLERIDQTDTLIAVAAV
ncbi:MAG: class I SAM-dependent methyltransferase [Candidatus Omnitrophica bacterium]|nr:class I SAM-dependent methyltransferase [Candidatus Omnitrophota bacterium]